MAIAQGDGSIVLTTKVDESGMKKGTRNLRSEAMKLAATYRKTGLSQSEAQKRAYKELGITTKETEKATKATEDYGKQAKISGSTAKGAFLAVGKVLVTVVAAASAAIVAITKQAVDAYAEYEQLVGGVETLFKDSAEKVKSYAMEAFRTTGLSANEYMKQVTSFSASLIRSTANDTEKAADIANMALIDISDNVNKMGSSMESVTLAYQGFAKQQYQLLDNLKLGYGGTKGEMERLLKDAQALTGVKYDINNLADVYSAIHAIQEELGITGTTAKEAEKTISGSAATTKAAWQNVLTAISGGGDLDRAIENLVDSISNLFENIVPVVEKSLQGIGRLIERVAPQLVQTVAKSLIKAIPSLLNAVYEMIIGLAKGIYQGIVELFSENTMQKVSSDIGEATTAQAALNKEIKGTEKVLDGALAGFDELNVLSKQEGIASDGFSITNAEAAILGTAAENAEKIEDSIKNTTIELSKWDEFKYGLMSEVNVSALENANNSMLKLTSSAKEYINTVKGSGLDVDFNQLIADLTNFQIAINGATSTAIAGGLDFATGLKGGKGSSAWQGLGEMAQGGYQFTIALRDLLGLETEALKQMFLPIANELPNLFKDLTPLQSALIDSFEKTINPLKTYLNELAWSKEIVTDEDINIVDSQFKNLIETLTSNIDATQEMAVQNIMELVEKGLLTDAEAKDVIAKTKKLYEQQQKQAVNAKDKIGQILRKAKEENREITIQEQLDIQSILKESEANIIEITSEGVSSQIDVLNDLRKEEGKISSARLSQVIQYANREFEERSKSADELYNSTIQEANTLYYDLGLIDDERYQAIVQSAKDTRSAQLLEAQKSREELVQEAIGLAGDIAKTVDPNTGEIYSKWELLWNAMYNKVVSMANEISGFSKGIINGLVDALNWVIDKINFVTEPFSNAEWFFGTKLPDYTISKIPYLAQGAVIPPNNKFLAVLGDQTHGTNVEAPLTTIKQALVEAMSEFGGNGNNQPIIIEIDGREVFRAVRNAETRYGSQTIIGGVVNAY